MAFDVEEYARKRNQKKSTNSEDNGNRNSGFDVETYAKQRNLPKVSEYLNSSVSSWLKRNESFVNKYNTRYSGENNSYRSDTSDWLSSVTTEKTALEKEAAEIRSWLDQYKDLLNKDYYNSVTQAIDGSLKAQREILSHSTKDHEFWSQFETEDAYKKWSADWLNTKGKTSADKVAQRQDIYQDNQDRIAEIEKKTGSNWFSEYFGGLGAEINALVNDDKSIADDYYAMIDEKEALEAENLRYERTQGVMDKHYMPITNEVTQIASNRDFSNATKEELWNYDMSTIEASEALSNGGYFDDDGNVRNAKGVIVQYANAPEVQDKLGLFLSAKDEGIEMDYVKELSATGGNYTNTWGNLMQEGDVNGWRHLDKDEITIYYYKLNTEGQASAYKFLEDMTTELTRRETQKRAEEINEAPALKQIFLNAASIPMNVVGGAVGLVEDATNLLKGEDINPYSRAHMFSNDASAIRADTAKDINNATGNAALPLVGTTFGDVYQSIMSAGDSAVASFIPGGHYLLGLNAASAEMKDLYERGASTEQMLAGGILAGAAESFFEKYSIGELKKIKNMDSKAVKNFADGFVRAMVMGGVEASEEMATEIANTLSDALVMGSQSDWVDLGTFVKNVVNAGIGGFISGGLMGGVAAKINNSQYNQKVNKQGQEIIDNGGIDALKQLALDVYSNKTGLDAKKSAKVYNKVVDDATAKNVGRLSESVGSTINAQNRSDIQKALIDKGLSKSDAKRVSEYLNKASQGYEFNEAEAAEVEGNDKIIEVLRDVVADPKSSINERTKRLISARLGKSLPSAGEASTQQAENASVTENASATENATEIKFEASVDDKTIVKETGAEVNVEEIVSNEGGNLMVKLDNGETVNARDLSFASNDAVVYEMVAKMGVNPNTAMTLVKAYNPASGVKAQTYAIDVPLAYMYGKIGYKKGLARLNLTDEQSATAYILGRDDVKASGRTWSDTSRKTPETNRAKAADDGIIYEGFELNEDSLTDIQKASLAGVRTIAKMSPTLEIHMFESIVENGKKYAVFNGKKVLAPNGFFRNGNEIYIDINAGKGTMGAMLYTASHEIVHFIAENSFEDFQVLADFLFEHYGENNVPVDQLINREIDKLKKDYAAKNKELPSEPVLYMKAYEEVVANAMSKMLADPTSYEKLAKLKSENLTLWEKIGEAIKRMLDKLKSMLGIYEGRTPDQMAAHYVDDFSAEVYNKLQDLYLKAFVNAEANYQASIGSRNLEDFADAKNTEGESLFQYKAMEADEDTYREMLKKWGKMTDSQISNLFLTIDNAMELIKDNLEALDYAWEADIDDRAFSPVKPNSDKLYQVSLDFSTLCRKRLLQQTVQAQLQEALNKPLTREEGIAIRDALIAIQEEGRQIEVACALCYVESARMKSPEQIRKFMANKEAVIKEFFAGKSGGSIKEKINKAETNAREKLHRENPNGIKGKDGSTMLDPRTAKLNQLPKKYADMIRSAKKEAKASYTPTAEEQRLIEVAKGMTVSDFTSPEGLENLAKNYRDLFDAYTSYVRNATKSKGIESDTWWRAGDSMQIGDVLIANMNKENGLRSQSWSDFQVIHILDYIAATIELATRNTKEQAYTKVPDFAELMGQTGVMINLSLIPTAKFNGKLEYDSTEGIDYKRSLELRDKYHATVGTICIGVDNVQIQMLLGDITVDYVIPYHKSGMSAVIRKAMHIPTWTQYEEYQSEKNLARADAKKQADKYGVKLLAENDPNYHKHPNFSDWFDIKEAQQITKMENANPSDKAKQKKYGVMYGGYMAMQNAANNYLKFCAERGISPKFSHEKADFTTEENYWKLLIDRKMVDNVTGEVIEQQTIKPIFDEKEVMRILNDELERYPKVKEDQEYAIRKVTEAYLSGNLKGGMSAKDIAKVMQTPVDNVTTTNIVASAREIKEFDSSKEKIEQNIKDIAEMSSVYNIDKSKLEKTGKRPSDTFDEHFKSWGNNLRSDELGDITVEKSSVKSEIRHGLTAEKIASIEAIPAVVKEGKVIFVGQKSESGLQRIVVCAPINIGNIPYYMGVMLQRDIRTQRLYLHNVAIEKEASEISQDDLLTTGSHESNENLFVTSILQNALVVKYQNMLSNKKNDGSDELYSLDDDSDEYSDRVLMGSLFSGGGTLEAGLVYQMLDKEFAVEYKASLASVYADNHGKEHLFVGDVQNFNSKGKQNVFYLHASPVCKNFSPASHKSGETELDILTAKATARVLAEQMPQVFTVENVKRYIGSEAYNIIINKLNELGYTWDVDVYKASDYGNATKRERMIIRAVKDGQLPEKPQKESTITSWGEATRDLWETDLIPSYLVKSKEDAIKNTPELRGIDLTKLDKPLMIYDTTKRKTVTFSWADELAPTLTTKCGDARIIMPDGKVYAPTPKFMGRIQGLPDDYKYPKAVTNAFKIIGNGIPTQLTKAVMGGVLDSAYEQTHDGQMLYSDHSPDSVSTRSLLANALETTAQNDIEKNKLAQYKSKIDLIEKEQAKLTELRAKIKELSFAKGARDTEAIKKLQFEANQTANRINVYDRQLLNLESTTALKNVLQREKKLAYDKAKKEGKEALAKYREREAKTIRTLMDRQKESRQNAVERADKTKMRRKIHNLVKELNSLLKNGNKKKNIKEEEKTTVATALALAEVLFNDDIKNEDIVRLGVDSVTEQESILLNEYRDLLDNRDALIAKIESTHGNGIVTENSLAEVGSIEEALAKVKNRISTLNGKLADVFERERARLNRATMNAVFDALITEYSKLADSGNDYIKNAYSEAMKTRLEVLKKDLDGKIAKDMSIYQLAEVYDAFYAIKHMISTSNKIFREGRAEDLATYVSNTQGEIFESTTEPKDRGVAADALASVFNEFSWNNLRPVDAFERLGSKTFEKLFWDYIHGMGTAARDVKEAGEVIANAREKYGYSKWNMKLADTAYTTREGLTFKPSLADKLSIYAFSKREKADGTKQAMDHMVDGGFTYDTGRTYKDVEDGKTYVRKKLSSTYRLSEGNIKSIIDSLTQEQRDYVDTILPYLTDMGKKGNEVSMTLYGIELFGDKVYFPLQSSSDYLNSTTQELGATQTMSSLANSSFTKQTTPGANNPIVLRGFDDVVLEHIEKMSNYHGLVIPIENLRRVFDNVSRDTEKNSLSTKALIGSRFGVEAQKYFAQLFIDLNGGISPSGIKSPLLKMFSRSKGMQVAMNSSVVAQQYFSVIRAMEVIDPKYFAPFVNGEAKKTDMKQYEELLKYAPIAIIKEMNGFDVGSSGRVKDYIGYNGARKDAEYINKKIDDFTMWGAGKMDELGWVTIWKAVKAEVASEQKLAPGTDEFYKACEIRFTEVVTKTQVYDSVASRSGYMRSKHDFVKAATSFMGEPTAVMGRYFVAGLNLVRAIKSGDKASIKSAMGRLFRTATVIAVSQTLGNLAKSLIYGGRDDEEDEALLEKWARNFAMAMVSDLNVFNSLPFTRDLVSIIEGWDVERPDLTLFADVVTSTKKMLDGDVTLDDSLNLIGSVGNLLGKPIKNVIREIKSAINIIDDIFVDNINPTDMGGAFAEGITGKERTKQTNLYNAIVRGDAGKIEAIKDTYKSDEAYLTAVKSALRENDSRIKKAVQALNSGNVRGFNGYIEAIASEGHFDAETVENAIRAEQSAFNTKINQAAEALTKGEDNEYKKIVRELRDSYRGIYSQDDIIALIKKAQEEKANETDDETEEATSIYKASDINIALDSGDTEMALEVIDNLVKTKIANGMTEKEAKSSLRSSMTSYWKKLTIEAFANDNKTELLRIRDLLFSTGLYGKNRTEVYDTMKDWNKKS